MDEEPITILMPALSSLSTSHRLRLSSHLHHRHRRLSIILSSPALFSLTLRRLRSLSLPAKTHLLGRHLLASLRHLTRFLDPPAAADATSASHILFPRDYDAILLLLLLCDLRRDRPTALSSAPPSGWRDILRRYFLDTVLSASGLGVSALLPFAEAMAQCWRFLAAMGCGVSGNNKTGIEVAASAAAVVALPSVEVGRGGVGEAECAICKEGMERGRDVCEMPCGHRFHWMCILPWVRGRNTCPCCRFRLPTDDVFGEIQRLWGVLVKIGGDGIRGGGGGDNAW